MDDALYKILKYIPYIIKFIIRSRTLFANLNDDKGRSFFEQSLDDLLGSFKRLVASKNFLLRSQGAILKYMHIIGVDLTAVYDPTKLWYVVGIYIHI